MRLDPDVPGHEACTEREGPGPTTFSDRICTDTRWPGLQPLTVKRWVSPTLTQLGHDRPILDRYSFRTIGPP